MADELIGKSIPNFQRQVFHLGLRFHVQPVDLLKPSAFEPAVLLREQTQPAHKRAEEAADVVGMMASDTTYRSGLVQFYRSWKPLEESLREVESFLDFPPRMESRWRLSRLEADLRVLGVDPGTVQTLKSDLKVRTQAELAGTLYVLEGSTLGARIVANLLQQKLGRGPQSGGSFFAAHGDKTGERWGSFQRWLEESLTEITFPECLLQAEKTFQKVESGFLVSS